VTVDWSYVPGATLGTDPGAWVGEPRDIVVYATAQGLEGEDYVYDILLEGSPPRLLPLVRMPVPLIRDAVSEDPKTIGPRDVDWDAVEGSTIDVAPTAWHVTLTGGERIVVYAHRYRREGGEYLFTLPLQGGRIQLPVARISDHLVAAVAEWQPLD
jgi:hypothetical protein